MGGQGSPLPGPVSAMARRPRLVRARAAQDATQTPAKDNDRLAADHSHAVLGDGRVAGGTDPPSGCGAAAPHTPGARRADARHPPALRTCGAVTRPGVVSWTLVRRMPCRTLDDLSRSASAQWHTHTARCAGGYLMRARCLGRTGTRGGPGTADDHGRGVRRGAGVLLLLLRPRHLPTHAGAAEGGAVGMRRTSPRARAGARRTRSRVDGRAAALGHDDHLTSGPRNRPRVGPKSMPRALSVAPSTSILERACPW